jgi:hypothetical protein
MTVTAPAPTTDRRPSDRGAIAAAAVPIALGALLAAHPLLMFDPFVLDGRLSRWFAVHYGLLLLLPALGAVAWSVLRGFDGRLAVVGRAGVLVFVAFYAAYDALAGIGTAMLLERTFAADTATQEAIAPLLTDWWVTLNPHWIANVGQVAWATFAVCAVILHRRAKAHPLVLWGLSIGGLYALAHGSIPATITLVAFAAAVWRVHARPTDVTAVPLPEVGGRA